jgi:CheY-like chemotaxis protein
LEIIVSDTGKGIGAEFLPHVFERFRQADSSISRAQGGLGLGLAITRNLVEMQGGSVHVDSPGEGEGATFTVKLPIVALRSADISQAGQEERVHPAAGRNVTFDNLPELTGLRVLAVDDQPDTLDMITSVLSQCGAEVETSTSAAAAFAKLGLWRPDVIIADIGMPDEDGYSLVKRIRALAPEQGGTIPAVALTAYARVEDRVRSLSSGYQMHVPKPVEPVELMTIVASLASNRGKAAGL